MHEISIAHSMVDLIETRLGRKTPLKSVSVTIGPLSGVSPDALAFCFPEVAYETGFGRPDFLLNKEEAEADCLSCSTRYGLQDFTEACAKCGSMDRKLLKGDRFTLDSVETIED